MTFLEKLEILMVEKNINKRQLSIQSGIPYSTIDNLWKKGYDNIKLSTLKAIASYFGVTLDFLARDNIENPKVSEMFLTEREKLLLRAYRSQPEMQTAVDKLLGIHKETTGSSIIEDETATLKAANKAFTAATRRK